MHYDYAPVSRAPWWNRSALRPLSRAGQGAVQGDQLVHTKRVPRSEISCPASGARDRLRDTNPLNVTVYDGYPAGEGKAPGAAGPPPTT